MSKKPNLEEIVNGLDVTDELEMVETPINPKDTKLAKEEKENVRTNDSNNDDELVSCLRNEKIIVRHVAKQTGMIKDPKHVLYGGMAENAVRVFVVPRLDTGLFVDVLTKKEKTFLEQALGLEPNALSIYKKVDNFWDDGNEMGISKVTLHKQDNYLDLSVPEDYIKYKILLANKNYIAPSLQELEDRPKATYQFVIVSEDTEMQLARQNMTAIQKCYVEYGKIENNKEILRQIVESFDGRPVASNTKLEFLQVKVNDLIKNNSKQFLKIVSDPMLPTKVLIRQGVEAGAVLKRGDFYYLKKDNSPLCANGEDPVLSVAAKFLNLPKNQETKFWIESVIKENK